MRSPMCEVPQRDRDLDRDLELDGAGPAGSTHSNPTAGVLSQVLAVLTAMNPTSA